MKATVLEPPNTQAFDQAFRGAPRNRGTSGKTVDTPSPTKVSDLAAFAQIFSSFAHVVRPAAEPVTPRNVPATPPKAHASPPEVISPSDIRRYLRYAEEHLGVENATSYEFPLKMKRYGPDILPHVQTSDLTAVDVGIPHGDALRLQRGSSDWWNHLAKRQREQDNDDARGTSKRHHSDPEDEPRATEVKDPVRYELRWTDGAQRYYGGYMIPCPRKTVDESVWYFCEARQDWFPTPVGYCADCPAGEDPDIFFSR